MQSLSITIAKSYVNPANRDIQEVVEQFPNQTASSLHTVCTVLHLGSDSADIPTTTCGGITYRVVDPLREVIVSADERLQARLEVLCSTLRSKY